MFLTTAPRRPEIDEYAIKFLVGLIALALPALEYCLVPGGIDSISASFWYTSTLPPTHGLWARNVFVGLLFAIAGLLLTYNGKDATEMWLTKLAALAALLIAMFPCACGCEEREILPHVHTASATVMFAVLAVFCYRFMRRAWRKRKVESVAQVRAGIYAACMVGMIVAIALFIAEAADRVVIADQVFWAEAIGLVSFGISWLTASHWVPGINAQRRPLFA
jgi:hypothetical protein